MHKWGIPRIELGTKCPLLLCSIGKGLVGYYLLVVILREALLSEQKSGPNGGCIKQMKVEEIVEI